MQAKNSIMNKLARQYAEGVPSQKDKMGPWAKVLMTAALAVSTAVAATDAAAQQQRQRQVMPERSAVNWGGQLGQVFGAAAGAALAGSVSDPQVRRVIVGATQEVGRNAAQMAVEGAYQSARYKPLPQAQSDHLDQYGLSAAFAYFEMTRLLKEFERGAIPRATYNQAQQQFFHARDAFANVIRSTQQQGYGVDEWSKLHTALQQRHVNEQEVLSMARDMVDRVNRPGGPGFWDPHVSAQTTSVAQLRQQAQQRNMVDAPVMR